MPSENEWSGYPDPMDPDNFWIDDVTGERVDAQTGERFPATPGGTYKLALHEDCGKRFNMHAGCVDCCPCDDCGLDRAYRLRRAELDSELQAMASARTFRSPYERHQGRNGQRCRILRELTDEERDAEVGTMYRVRFEEDGEDGAEIDAWPEELHGSGDATVIQVEDLGAALEANDYGRYVCWLLGYAGSSICPVGPDRVLDPGYVGTHAASAAALARLALVEEAP